MSILHLVVAYVLVAAAAALFLWCLCVVAGRADDRAEEALRRERLRDAARAGIDNRNGYRGR